MNAEKSNLIEALAKAQSEFPEIKKDRENTFYKSRYATLDSVITATRTGLTKNQLAVTHAFSRMDGTPVLVTTLHHVSGETLESTIPIIAGDGMQSLGSAITYARRYNLCGLLNVTADEDDDGNATVASNGQDFQRRSTPPPAAKSKPSPTPTAAEIGKALAARARKSYHVADSIETLLEAISKVGDYREKFPGFESYSAALGVMDEVGHKYSEDDQAQIKKRVAFYLKVGLAKKIETEAAEVF